MDLRQELQDLNLNNQEVDKWLGAKFDEKDEFDNDPYEVRFIHDIPLQRSVSLDCGIDIFNYLQTLGSDYSESIEGSTWTVQSDRDSLVFERYRSFEDIPASQTKVKSRRVSEYDNAFFGRNLTLNVLKDSYKCLDSESGRPSPQVKKLQRSFTFTDFSVDFKEVGKGSNNDVVMELDTKMLEVREDSNEMFLPKAIGHISVSLRSSLENLKDKGSHLIPGESDNDYLELRYPVYRSISVETKSQEKEDSAVIRQRRVGVIDKSFVNKKEMNLRKELLIKRNLTEYKSCENISMPKGNIPRCRSLEMKRESTTPVQLRSSYNLNVDSDETSLLKLKRTYSFASSIDRQRVVPTIIISNTDECVDIVNVAKIENSIATNTSNMLDISRNCDCRICTDVEVGKKCNIRSVLSKLFVKIVSCREYSRKLTYWDENNNWSENEMYNCIMHILKLMLGLWLRHLNHS